MGSCSAAMTCTWDTRFPPMVYVGVREANNPGLFASLGLRSWGRKDETEGRGEVKARIKKGLDALRVSECLVFLGCWVFKGSYFTLNPAIQTPHILPASKGSQLEGKLRSYT